MTPVDSLIAEVAAERGWFRLRSADDFIEAWQSFVTECARGYSMSSYEFENDRSVRGMIEELLGDERIARIRQYAEFRRSIDATDTRYRALLQADIHVARPDAPWWERGVPRYGALTWSPTSPICTPSLSRRGDEPVN